MNVPDDSSTGSSSCDSSPRSPPAKRFFRSRSKPFCCINFACVSETENVEQDIDHSDVGKLYDSGTGRWKREPRALDFQEKFGFASAKCNPSSSVEFPIRNLCGKKRKLQSSWCDLFPGLIYSPSQDAALCLPCVLFAVSSQTFGTLSRKPYLNWNKAKSDFQTHDGNTCHVTAMTRFLRVCCDCQTQAPRCCHSTCV